MPDRKVTLGALAGSIVIVIAAIWGIILPDYPIPAEVASALTVIVTFVMSYFVPSDISSVTVQRSEYDRLKFREQH